jgi:glutathione S-transferase
MKLILCEVPGSNDGSVETFSPFCLKVRRALRGAGLEFEARQEANPGSFKRHNSLGQVPILLADEKPLADSTKILEFIVAHTGKLMPSEAAQQAEAWFWEEFADRSLNGYLVAARWLDESNWPRTRAAYFGTAPWFVGALIAPQLRKRIAGALRTRDFAQRGLPALWEDLERLLDRLETRAPQADYWVGDVITVADVSLFGQLQALRTDLTPAQVLAVEKRPRLRAYLDRVDVATRAYS